ncbi:GntR family transcriptional regulator [Novosphingobium sp. ZN18A2]|uniref:GntR family transcriptional regulator n=1 Tax=Novosphingobium sp. ZN18A2 TaxID=3079861 RepID=UPI0030D5904A
MSRASERAYELIRALILSGELQPGSQLGEEALAERCGVSRTPVREALRRLEAELFVKRNEAQRTFVADWTLEDVADTFELRAMVESLAARRAAMAMDDGTLERLRACNSAIREAINQPEPDTLGFLDGNREFHAIILAAAGSRRLEALLNTLVEQPVVWRTAYHYGREELLRSYSEHEELIAAFSRRDGAWAEAVMAAHIRRAFHAYADAHQSRPAFEPISEVAE